MEERVKVVIFLIVPHSCHSRPVYYLVHFIFFSGYRLPHTRPILSHRRLHHHYPPARRLFIHHYPPFHPHQEATTSLSQDGLVPLFTLLLMPPASSLTSFPIPSLMDHSNTLNIFSYSLPFPSLPFPFLPFPSFTLQQPQHFPRSPLRPHDTPEVAGN